jgi:hypothetical protein
LLEGRLAAALVLFVTGTLGLKLDADLEGQVVKVASTYLPALLLVWSVIQKLDGRELYRRLSAGVLAAALPAIYTVLGFVAPELADADRSTAAQGVIGLVVLAVSAVSFRRKRSGAQP